MRHLLISDLFNIHMLLILYGEDGICKNVGLKLVSWYSVVEEEVELLQRVTLHLGKNEICPGNGEEREAGPQKSL